MTMQMTHNKQSQKYLIGRSYKNDEFYWPFLFGDCKLRYIS